MSYLSIFVKFFTDYHQCLTDMLVDSFLADIQRLGYLANFSPRPNRISITSRHCRVRSVLIISEILAMVASSSHSSES